ncbi:MAG: TonB-dependent receptor [Oceanospirillaceae bacterium]|nr:TonB-dependent receptor [Oceanospirillaceae bacterium]
MFISCFKKLPLVIAVSLVASAAVADQNTLEIWSTAINSSSTSIDKDDIEFKQADHLSDLLRDIPGINIGGAHSVNQRINIRGLEDLDLDISIDGAKQNNYMYHHMGNLLINADILKSVDIEVGKHSVINAGLGGAISFETKDAKDLLFPEQTMGARVQVHGASNNYRGYSLTSYAKFNETFDALAYINGVSRGNPTDGDGNTTIGNDGTINNLLFKIGADINEQNRLDFSWDSYKDHGDYAPRADMGVATNSSITGTAVYPTQFDRKTMTLNYTLDLGDTINLEASLYQNTMTLWRDEQQNARASYRYREGKGEHKGFNLLAESYLGDDDFSQTLRYGLSTYKQTSALYDDNVLTAQESARSMNLFIEDEIDFGNGLTLTPGIRHNRVNLKTPSTDKNYTKATAALATQYQINDNWSIHASSAQLFKAPELTEIYTAAGTSLIANAQLKAETGVNNEIGFTFSDTNLLGLDKLTASTSIFRTRINHYIEAVDVAGNYVYQRQNIGKVNIRGLEVNVSMQKGNLATTLSYAKSKSKISQSGNPLDREVGDSIGIAFDYVIPSQNISLNWSSEITLKEHHYDKPSYNVHSVTAKWTPSKYQGLTLTAGIENLFDEQYTSHASRIGDTTHPVFGNLHLNDYEPGRNVKLSAAYQF